MINNEKMSESNFNLLKNICKSTNSTRETKRSLVKKICEIPVDDQEADMIIDAFEQEKEEEKPIINKDIKRIISYFREAIDEIDRDPEKIKYKKFYDDESRYLCVEDILGDAESVKKCISRFLDSYEDKKHKWFITKEQREYIVAEVILKDLLSKGEFIKDNNGTFYYFNEEEKNVIIINKGNNIDKLFSSEVYSRYNIYTSKNYVINHIFIHALKNHTLREVQKICYFNSQKKVLYFYNNDNEYYRIDGKSITLQPNGKEVLFKKLDQHEKITYIQPTDRAREEIKLSGVLKTINDTFLDYFVNSTNFVEGSNLSTNEQYLQLALYLHSLPFRNNLRTKPIAQFLGEKGSTKSFTLTKILKLIMTIKYEVEKLTKKEEDFITTLANNAYLIIDNLDNEPTWLADYLASIATSAYLTKRKLYTTWESSRVKPDCFMGITSRMATMKREDIADRSLIFHCGRLEKYIDEHTLLQPLMVNKNYFLSLYFDNLNMIIKTMSNNNEINLTTTHRLADWVVLAIIIDKALRLAEKYDVDLDVALENINKEKSAFIWEGELFVPLMKQLISDHKGEPLTARQIVEIFTEIDSTHEYSVQQIASICSNNKTELDELFGFEVISSRKREPNQYIFGKRKKRSVVV